MSRRDRNHERCADLLRNASRPLIVPALVVTEVAYFLGDRLGPEAEVAFGRAIASGELAVEPVAAADWSRMVDLAGQYSGLPLGLVDASVVAAAERLGVETIATLDRKHFTAVRPRHVAAFELLPA